MNRTDRLLPEILYAQVNDAHVLISAQLADSLNALPEAQSEALLTAMPLVFAASRFAADQCKQYPQVLAGLINNGSLFAELDVEALTQALQLLFQEAGNETSLMASLRRFRNRELLRIAWRDIAGWSDIDSILRELSLLAEIIIAQSLEYLFQRAIATYGVPLNQQGKPQRLVVLAMGKLGAYELNFSSDVDLIFAYEQDGELTDRQQTSYGEFYTRLIRRLIKLLDEITADGFVFRVDVRLRPFGASGPLVMNFTALESYYATQANEWERYAMIKARVIAGDHEAAATLQALLHAFTYRRYLDYRALEELRRLKQKIKSELLRKDKPDNIKLGKGGIREIEFIAQVFQLVRGGQEPYLQERSVIRVLTHLGERGYLPPTAAERLIAHYRFLRTVENRIQQYADQHSHELPSGEKQQQALVYALGYCDWRAFLNDLNQVCAEVNQDFELTFATAETESESVGIETTPWLDRNTVELARALEKLGFAELTAIQTSLSDFLRCAAVGRLTSRGRDALNRLLPLLLGLIVKLEINQQNLVATRLLNLFEVIATRNVYYTLLIENPGALARLVQLAASSAWIIRYIAEQPLLLDELLDNRQLYRPLSRPLLREELALRMAQINGNDQESVLTVLRQFKQANVLKIAASDIARITPVMVVSDYLTWLAEVLVEEVLVQAWRITAQKYAMNAGESWSNSVQGFAVIAYGKMGGIEMSYSSDLDLVFLYDDSLAPQLDAPAMFYVKLAQRMIGMLTSQMLSGTLYEVDLRLRPSGNSGLLVSTMSAFEHYQLNSAWVWELQALVRARFVAGDQRLETVFRQIRVRALAHASARQDLRGSIVEMREKMRCHLLCDDETLFDLKQGQGGIVDIEFLVQYGVLQHAAHNPALLEYTDVVRLLEILGCIGYVSEENSAFLKQAYCLFRERIHRAALLEQSPGVAVGEYEDLRAGVYALWLQITKEE